ncbi:MAG: glycosyltransferase [Bacteroidota bacterium]
MVGTLSVIMTVYDQADYVGEAVESIIRQTYREFDFIIIDDGSDDQSLAKIQKYDDPRIRIFSRDHQGRGSALNFALAQTNATWVAFIDADDIALPDRLLLQTRALAEDEAIDAISGWYQLVDERGNIIREKRLPSKHEEIVELMPVQCSMCFPAAIIRKNILVQAGMFDEKLVAAVDYDLWLKILDNAKFHNIPINLIKYRISSNSISSRLKDVQSRYAYEIGVRYLKEKYRIAQRDDAKAKISLKLGKLEYYQGTMVNARRHLAKLLWYKPYFFITWRFYLASLLGNRVFTLLRSLGFADSIGNIFRKSSVKHNYFVP